MNKYLKNSYSIICSNDNEKLQYLIDVNNSLLNNLTTKLTIGYDIQQKYQQNNYHNGELNGGGIEQLTSAQRDALEALDSLTNKIDAIDLHKIHSIIDLMSKYILKLIEAIKVLGEQNQNYKDKILDKSRQLIELSAQFDELKKRIADYERECSRYKNQISRIEDELQHERQRQMDTKELINNMVM